MGESQFSSQRNLGHVQMFGIYAVPEELVEPEGVTITRLLSPSDVHISAPDPVTQIVSISFSTVMDGNVVRRISLIDWCKVITKLGEKEGLSDKRIHALCCIPMVQRAKNAASLPEEPTPSVATEEAVDKKESEDDLPPQDVVAEEDHVVNEPSTAGETEAAEERKSVEQTTEHDDDVEQVLFKEELIEEDEAPVPEESRPKEEAAVVDKAQEQQVEALVFEPLFQEIADEEEQEQEQVEEVHEEQEEQKQYANEEEDETINVSSSDNTVEPEESMVSSHHPISESQPCTSQRITLGRDPKCAAPRIVGEEAAEEGSGSPDSQTLDGNGEQPLFHNGDKKKKKKHHKKDKKRHRRERRSSDSESDRPKKKRRISIEEVNGDRLPIPKIVIRMNMEDDSRKAEIVRETTVYNYVNGANEEQEEDVLPSTSHEFAEETQNEPIVGEDVENSPVHESLNLSDVSATQTDPTLFTAEHEEQPRKDPEVKEDSSSNEQAKWDDIGNWQYWLPAHSKKDRLLPESTSIEKRYRMIVASEPKMKRFYKEKPGWLGATKDRKVDDHRDAITLRFYKELSDHYEAARNFDSRLSSPPEPLERFGPIVIPYDCQAQHPISDFCIPINNNPYLISRIRNYKQLSLGQVVWAMWSRQEWWPGTIASFERGEKTGEIAQVKVLWINELTQNVVPYKNVLPFDYAFPYKFNVKSVSMKYLRAVSKAILINGYVGYWEPFLNKSLFRCMSLDLDCHGMISHLPSDFIKDLLQPQVKEKEKVKRGEAKGKCKQNNKKVMFDEMQFEAFLVCMFIKQRSAFPSGEFFTSTWELYGDFLESKYFPKVTAQIPCQIGRSPIAGSSSTPEPNSENHGFEPSQGGCFQQITREELEQALEGMPIERRSVHVDEENDRSAIDEYLEKNEQVNPEDLKKDALHYKRVSGSKMREIKASKAETSGRRTRILDYGPLCKLPFPPLPGEDPDNDRLFQDCEIRSK